jgi:phage baseplate assembly protein W
VAASFLGTGWSFPPEFGRGGGEVAMVSDVEDIQQSLALLFATAQGERPMLESFGCSLESVLFGEMAEPLVNQIQSLIHDAVLRHEPRIRLLSVDVTPEAAAGLLRIQLAYAVQATNSRYNMVFPLYLNEAVAPGHPDGLRAGR